MTERKNGREESRERLFFSIELDPHLAQIPDSRLADARSNVPIVAPTYTRHARSP
jgi:hypothetical protein